MGFINDVFISYKIKKAINEQRFKEASKLIEKLDNRTLKEKYKVELQFKSENFEFKIEELEQKEEYENVFRLISTLYDSKFKIDYTNFYMKKYYSLGYNCYINYQFEKAKKYFEAVIDYKDSAQLFKQCHNKIEYQKAIMLYASDKVEEAYEIFKKLDNFEKLNEYKERCKKEIEYKKAINLLEQKQLTEAAKIFKKNINYKDSVELLKKIEEQIQLAEIENNKTEDNLLSNEINSNEEIIESSKVIERKDDIKPKKIDYSEFYNKGVVHFNNGEYYEAKNNFILSENYRDSKKYLSQCEKEIKKKYIEEKFIHIFGKKEIKYIERNSLKLVILYNKKNKKYVYCACFVDDEKPHEAFYLALAKSKLEKIKKENTYLLMDCDFYIIYSSSFGDNINEGYFIYKYLNSNISQVDNNEFTRNISQMSLIDDVDDLLENASKKTSDILECVKAYTGELDLYKLTREKLDSISELIEDSINRNKELKILVQGSARSGKTIIALSLLHYYKEFKFLLMNYYFYISLRDAFKAKNLNFPSDRIFHHDLGRDHELGCGINKGTSYDNYRKSFKFPTEYIIVDEAQRLSNLKGGKFVPFAERDILLLNSKIGIFLGDDLQRINPDYDEGFEKIIKLLKSKNKEYYNYEFDGSIGIPTNLTNAYKYILNNKNEFLDYINENKIVLYNDYRDFILDFKNNPDDSKHYSTITQYEIPRVLINTGLIKLPYNTATDNQCFLNKKYVDKYVLNTFNVISRDLHYMYLIIPDEISYSEKYGIYHKYGSENKYTPFLINHLYVNMTRATEKLVIYTKDVDLFKYLEKQIKIVCKNAEILDNPNISIVEQKLNYIKSYSEKDNVQKLFEKWEKHKFEGFVHATDFDNAIKILRENELKSRMDATGLFRDIADKDVIVKTSPFVTNKVRFYYSPGTPALYHFQKRSNDLVIFVFNQKMINNYKTFFSNGNAASQNSVITGVIDEALKYDWETIFSRGAISKKNIEIIRKRNAELLVEGPIKVNEYIEKIIVQSFSTEEKLKKLFPQYSNIIKEDNKYFQ